MAINNSIYKSGISEAQPTRTLANKFINLVRYPRTLFRGMKSNGTKSCAKRPINGVHCNDMSISKRIYYHISQILHYGRKQSLYLELKYSAL